MWSRRGVLALLLGLAACASAGAPEGERAQGAGLAFGLVREDGGAGLAVPHWDGGGRWSVPEGFVWTLEEPLLACSVRAAARAVDGRGAPCVRVRLAPDDARRLGELSARGLGRRMAVLVDGRVVCAPRLSEPLRAEHLELSANFSAAEADALLALLQRG